jgi:excisionase family DNA binding protein
MSAEAYTVDDICSILGCEAETAVERIMAGDLPGLKFGRGWIIPRDAFSQRLNELALEAAQARRKDRAAGKVASKVIQAAQGVGKPAGRRVARVPPALPGLPGAAPA